MRKAQEITVISYVEKDGVLTRFDELAPAERRAAATALKLAYLNELYIGKAKFFCTAAEGGRS